MSSYRQMVREARELSEFFIGTFAETAISEAIRTGNRELLRLVLAEYGSQRQLIEDAEAQHANPNY